MSYLIEINEAQRVALLKLIADNVEAVDPVVAEPDTHPLAYWISMLSDLPKVDQRTADGKQMINGFCL